MGTLWLEVLTLAVAAALFGWARGLERANRGIWVEAARLSGVLLISLALIRLLVVEPFEGIGPSMLPTLPERSQVLVDKSAYGWRLPVGGLWLWKRTPPRPGEVIVFEGQNAHRKPELLLKRVVAVGGDLVRVEGERVFVNGEPLESAPSHRDSSAPFESWSASVLGHPHRVFLKAGVHAPSSLIVTWQVPSGFLFVVGDNRVASYDSRDFGPVREENVVGRVIGMWGQGKFSRLDAPAQP